MHQIVDVGGGGQPAQEAVHGARWNRSKRAAIAATSPVAAAATSASSDISSGSPSMRRIGWRRPALCLHGKPQRRPNPVRSCRTIGRGSASIGSIGSSAGAIAAATPTSRASFDHSGRASPTRASPRGPAIAP